MGQLLFDSKRIFLIVSTASDHRQGMGRMPFSRASAISIQA